LITLSFKSFILNRPYYAKLAPWHRRVNQLFIQKPTPVKPEPVMSD
jgi:hypothetical protein